MIGDYKITNPTTEGKTIIYSETDRVRCSGENHDHPLVYYTIPTDGFVVCGYCDLKFARKLDDSWEDETVIQMKMTSRGTNQ